MSDAPAANPLRPCMRILIVDDHAVVREGLKRMLEASEPAWTVEEAANAFEALERVRAQAFDVAVVDISMPGMSGLDFLKRVRSSQASLRVLMLSMYAEEQYAARAFKSGANGYVTKDSATRELVNAIRKVTAGGAYVSEALAQSLALGLGSAGTQAPHERLSDRELDILRRLAAGDRPTEIAHALHISIKTVSTHKARILARLQLPNTAALVRYAMEHRLIPEGAMRPRDDFEGSDWQQLPDGNEAPPEAGA
ncbi:MAG TPA: response regulator transcription factor [Burkholderiaceae bacterium]